MINIYMYDAITIKVVHYVNDNNYSKPLNMIE